MTLTTPEWGLVLFVLAVLAFVAGRMPAARVYALVIGIVILGAAGGGHLFGWAAGITRWLDGFLGTATTWAVGVAFPGLLAIILVAITIHDLHPRTGKPTRRTFWAAGLLAVMIAAGSTNVQVLNNLGPQIRHGVQTTQTSIGG